MNLKKTKEFLLNHLLDMFFYLYLVKLTFINNDHSKAEIYLGTLLSVVMLINKIIGLKKRDYEERIVGLEKRSKANANSVNLVSQGLQKISKIVDNLNAKNQFQNIKSPFTLRNK
jgi:hypothetical protein